ncbi:hypothetical protein DFJ74DRAFT_620380, partial [Hyaloraphidium curvatum]
MYQHGLDFLKSVGEVDGMIGGADEMFRRITAHVAALDLHVRRADPAFFDDPANAPSSAAAGAGGTPRKKRGEEEQDEDTRTLYCLCGRESYGEMVACDNEECEIEWFHYDCVGLLVPPRGKWYCTPCLMRGFGMLGPGPTGRDLLPPHLLALGFRDNLDAKSVQGLLANLVGGLEGMVGRNGGNGGGEQVEVNRDVEGGEGGNVAAEG